MTQQANVTVVYPLLKGDIELRYSIRSLLRYGSNVGQIVIIGDRPKFIDYDKVLHIPFTDRKGKPYENVWNKLKAIAEDDRISSRILWMNDDIYIQKPFNAAAIPNYCRSMDLAKMRVLNADIATLSSYKRVLKRTRDALKKRGMTTFHFGTHQPTNFEKEKILATYREFEKEIPSGLSFRCCYHNMHRSVRTVKSTVVVKAIGSTPPAKWAFASRGTANLAILEKGLKGLFPKRSELEI